jgi:ferrochelatase
MPNKKGILIVNLGTPDSFKKKDVKKYLIEFLTDKRVIDYSFLLRNFLVRFLIIPLRLNRVVKLYENLWLKEGSPLMYHGLNLLAKVKEKLGDEYSVELAMRYQNPSIKIGLEKLKQQKVSSITVLPLFPQYASATSGSVAEKVIKEISNWNVIPELKIIQAFYIHPKFIKAFAENGKKFLAENKYDHILFSYHGIPERHLRNAGKDFNKCNFPDCASNCSQGKDENMYCYRSSCYETSYLIAKELGLKEDEYSICFQSRLGKEPWLEPYSEEVSAELPKNGKKKVLAFSPAFVADCLETTSEVGEEYKEIFMHNGGEQWDLVESLNSSDLWVECVCEIVK